MSTPKSERTRNSILESARRLIEEARPDEWTMEDVADTAGVTRTTVYRYFPSRTQLLIETVRYVDETEQATERFSVLHDSTSALEALDRWVELWVDYIPHIHRLAQALLASRLTDKAAAQAWDDRMAFLHQSCQRLVEWLQQDGVLADQVTVKTGADLMWAIASIQVWDALTEQQGWSAQEYRDHIATTLRRSITTDTSSRRIGKRGRPCEDV